MYLFNLKREVKNKKKVEASIYETNIIGDFRTFISFYLEPQLTTRIIRVPRYDYGREVLLSGNLSIFSNPDWLIPKNIFGRGYLSETKFK